MQIQPACKAQSKELAYLINLAGEGIPEYLWRGMAEHDEPPLEIGAQRAAREEGGFSYRNARVCVERGELMGMIIAYRQPDPYDLGDLQDYPEIVRPLVRLEAEAPGSWYINAVATHERFRGRGVARLLLQEAEQRAVAAGCDSLSLIVASENGNARRLYDRLGYRPLSALPVVPYEGCLHGGEWQLLVKRL